MITIFKRAMGNSLYTLLALFIVVSITLTSCKFSWTTTDTSTTTISFSLATSRAALLKGSTPEQVVYIDHFSERASLKHKAIESGTTSLSFNKNSIGLFGIASTLSSKASSKDISSSVVGSVAAWPVVTCGLSSLPISSEASSTLDLGALSFDGTNYTSTLEASDLADKLGYSENILEAYGLWDQCLMLFMNPDINRNGTYDSDEDLIWQFRCDYFFNVKETDFNLETGPNIEPSSLSPQSVYELKFWSGFDDPPLSGAQLECYDSSTGALTGEFDMLNSFAPSYEDIEYNFRSDSSSSQTIPQDGNFLLSFPGTGDSRNFMYQTMHFVKPGNNWEALLAPLHSFDIGEDGIVHSISWAWSKASGDTWVSPDSAEVAMRTRQFRFSIAKTDGTNWDIFVERENPTIWLIQKKITSSNSLVSQKIVTGPDFTKGGTLDISSLGIRESEISSICNDYHDLADNVFAFPFTLGTTQTSTQESTQSQATHLSLSESSDDRTFLVNGYFETHAAGGYFNLGGLTSYMPTDAFFPVMPIMDTGDLIGTAWLYIWLLGSTSFLDGAYSKHTASFNSVSFTAEKSANKLSMDYSLPYFTPTGCGNGDGTSLAAADRSLVTVKMTSGDSLLSGTMQLVVSDSEGLLYMVFHHSNGMATILYRMDTANDMSIPFFHATHPVYNWAYGLDTGNPSDFLSSTWVESTLTVTQE